MVQNKVIVNEKTIRSGAASYSNAVAAKHKTQNPNI